MVEEYFIWRHEEYEWNGRSEYKKAVIMLNLTHQKALSFCEKYPDLRMEKMDKLDDTFEK